MSTIVSSPGIVGVQQFGEGCIELGGFGGGGKISRSGGSGVVAVDDDDGIEG